MESPCIDLCVINEETGHCKGCGRSIAEISQWASMTDPERRSIMATLPERLKTAKAGE